MHFGINVLGDFINYNIIEEDMKCEKKACSFSRASFRNVKDEVIGGNVHAVSMSEATRKKIAEHNPHQIEQAGHTICFLRSVHAESTSLEDSYAGSSQKRGCCTLRV
jgi:hypothetical protein